MPQNALPHLEDHSNIFLGNAKLFEEIMDFRVFKVTFLSTQNKWC